VRPLVQTVYVATAASATSRPLVVNVRPRLRLAVTHRTHGVLRVSAARGFVRRFGYVQVWRTRAHVCATVQRVRLTRSAAAVSPTVVTTAGFRLHLRHGLRVRALMPRS
jgi:hypothetical protein